MPHERDREEEQGEVIFQGIFSRKASRTGFRPGCPHVLSPLHQPVRRHKYREGSIYLPGLCIFHYLTLPAADFSTLFLIPVKYILTQD